jgi:hypothetical protein
VIPIRVEFKKLSVGMRRVSGGGCGRMVMQRRRESILRALSVYRCASTRVRARACVCGVCGGWGASVRAKDVKGIINRCSPRTWLLKPFVFVGPKGCQAMQYLRQDGRASGRGVPIRNVQKLGLLLMTKSRFIICGTFLVLGLFPGPFRGLRDHFV